MARERIARVFWCVAVIFCASLLTRLVAGEKALDELEEETTKEAPGGEGSGLEVPAGVGEPAGDPALPDKGDYTVELVTWDDPSVPVDKVAISRTFRGAMTVAHWILGIKLDGKLVTPPDSKLVENLGLVLSVRSRRKTDLDDGEHRFTPGSASFVVKGDEVEPGCEAVVVKDSTIRLRLVPVTFESTNAERTEWAPFTMKLSADGQDLLDRFRKVGPMIVGKPLYRLTLYLPAGEEYVCSWGKFRISEKGEVAGEELAEDVRLDGRRFHWVRSVERPGSEKGEWFETTCGKVPIVGPLVWRNPGEAVVVVGTDAGKDAPTASLVPHALHLPPVGLKLEPAAAPAELSAILARKGVTGAAFKTKVDAPWSGAAQLTVKFRGETCKQDVAVAGASHLHLFTRRLRSAYLDNETIECRVVNTSGKAGTVDLVLLEAGRPELKLGSVAIEAGPMRSVFVRLDAGQLHPGDYELVARMGEEKSLPVPLAVRSSLRKSNLLVSNITICTSGWNQTPLPPSATRQAAIGFDMLTRAGHDGFLTETVDHPDPRLSSALARQGLPTDYGIIRGEGSQFLDECVRQRIGYIDYISPAWGWYNEGLAFHHTYPPDVDRWVRREQLMFGAISEYPSLWGPNYTWFPRLFGYVEGGVDTDTHRDMRNMLLAKKLDEQGFTWPSQAEQKFFAENCFSQDQEKRARAEAIMKRMVGRIRGYGKDGFYEHFRTYREHIREVRPDGMAFAFENAGHDAAGWGNYLPLFYGALDAATMEAYTDFGDWALEPAFVTDWVRGAMKACPDKQRPFWLAAEWSAPPPVRYNYMLMAVARRAEGTAYPFPAEWPSSMDRTVGTIVSFLKAYGGVQPFVEVEPGVAILCSFNQMVFDGRTQYAVHAYYYDLLRAQYPAQCIYEETVERGGLRESGIKLLFIVRQTVPLPAKVIEEIQAFQAAGGLVVMDSASTLPLPGAHRLSFSHKHIWEEGMGGFEQGHRLALWNQYLRDRDELRKLLEGKVKPFAQSDDERIVTSTLVGGDVRFVFAINDAFDPEKPEQQLNVFFPKNDVPLRLRNPDAAVYDLQTMERLTGEASEGRLLLKLDLFNHPGLILAALPEPIGAITTDAPTAVSLGRSFAVRSRLIGQSGKPIAGPTPVRYVLRSPSGKARDPLFRAAGVDDPVPLRLGVNDEVGQWTLEVTDLVSGKQISAPIAVSAPEERPRYLSQVGRVVVAREEATRKFMQDRDEKYIFLEENQRHLEPLAEKLAAAIQKAGGKARILDIDPTCFDEVLMRWYPTEWEQRQYREIEAGTIVGVRTSMKAYIDPKTRGHVPALGGYSAIPPDFIVHRPSIVFSGGRLAESLACVTSNRASPDYPGPGNAVLDLIFSAYEARRHTLAVFAADAAGFEAGIEKAIALLNEPAKQPPVAERPPNAGPLPYRLAADSPYYTTSPALALSPATAPGAAWREPARQAARFRHAIADEFKVFSAAIVAVNRKGDLVVQPCYGKRRVLVSRDGKALGAIETPKGGFHVELADDASSIFLGLMGDGRVEWLKQFDGRPVVVQCTPDGVISSLSLLWPKDGNGYAEGFAHRFSSFFVLAPDSKTLYCSREGGLTIGPPGGPYRLYNHAQHFRHWREVHSPDWPMGMALSSDGKTLALGCWAHPTANSMGGPIFMNAMSPEVLAIDTETLQTIWKFAPPTEGTWVHAPARDCVRIAPDGSRVGYVGGSYLISVFDRAGKLVWSRALRPAPQNQSAPTYPDFFAMSDDGEVVLVTYSGLNLTALIRNGREPISFDAAAAAALAPDGRFVLCSSDGTISGYTPDAADREAPAWRKELPGGRAACAPVGKDGFVLVLDDGSVERWNWNGEVVWKLAGAALLDTPAKPLTRTGKTTTTLDLPGWPVETLDILKKHCGARLLVEGDGSQPLRVPPSAGFLDVHLVYRKPKGNPVITLTLADGMRREEFILDLPAPWPRSQDIAWPGLNRPLTAEIRVGRPSDASDAPVASDKSDASDRSDRSALVLIKEFQLWEFEWPSKNLAYVRPVTAETQIEGLGTGDEKKDGEEEAADGEDIEAGDSLYGKMKDAHIRVRNQDPDQVAGPFLPAGDSPLKVLDGRLYSANQTAPWYDKVNTFGLWFELDFRKPVDFDLIAFYAHTNRQSDLVRCIGFESGDGGLWDTGKERTFALAQDNDQFFRLFFTPKSRTKVLDCYLGEIRKNYGASEIEVYRLK